MLYRQEDMPFTADGMTPDILVNAHCIPSRMTVGHLMEMSMGRQGAERGETYDTVPFSAFLPKREYHDVLYDPFTGRKLQARVYMGCIMYQKLKHMVSDKCQSRAQGRHDILTRQPVEGRSRDGGQRTGEMERDAIVAHGASAYLQDRLYINSDPFQVPLCKRCGVIAQSETLPCRWCKDHSRVEMVKYPYSFKLLIRELMSMNIVVRTK